MKPSLFEPDDGGEESDHDNDIQSLASLNWMHSTGFDMHFSMHWTEFMVLSREFVAWTKISNNPSEPARRLPQDAFFFCLYFGVDMTNVRTPNMCFVEHSRGT